MKTVKSKKFHTWKDKWKRKKRSRYTTSWYNECVPKEFIKEYHKQYRAEKREALHKIMKGVPEEEIEFRYNHRHSALWDWW